MKKLPKFIISYFFLNPFQVCEFKYLSQDFSISHSNKLCSLGINTSNNSSRNHVHNVILINSFQHTDQSYSIDNNHCDKNIKLTGDVPDKVFKKPDAYFEEKSKRKSERKSTTSSELTFRQQTDTVDGKKRDHRGASDPQDPQNLEKFEKAGIPIDKIKDPRKTPDSHNQWKWDKSKKQWILIGELKIKLPTGKIVTESEWNDIIRDHSGKV
uniref:Uncharacterized protein n=1 Tax=Sebdenia flabellata TaxID=42024 RepID=A0A1C9C9T9_9FLOR|nr:hypothetical protein Sebd_064 [Sebdenia flabellata]AOM65151.1 hypothetical protein Sebd_064 [Sebdenia flabellata]